MNEDELHRLPEAPYAFRPAKRIQRMMFCDSVRLLRGLRPLEKYRYLGLGHWQFVDFELMRREVGIREMVSIEQNTRQKARVEANKPFKEIDLLFGPSSEKLQEIDLSQPTIAWLDYTSKLKHQEMSDLKLLVSQLPAGSVVAVTVNGHPGKEDERLPALIATLGSDVVPGDVSEDDLDKDGLPKVLRRILVEQLGAIAYERPVAARLQQFMFVRYVDRSPMVFWAALIVDETIEDAVAALPFNRLEQFRPGDEALEILVPQLTTREVIMLNEQIQAGSVPAVTGLDPVECTAYASLHRWYPAVPLPF